MRLFLLAAVVLFGTSCGVPASAPTATGFLPVSDHLRLYYEVHGTGPDTVVMVHGGPGLHLRYLAAAFTPLEPKRTLIYYDQRGRGRSDAIADSALFGGAKDVEDLEAVRTHFKLERMALVAHHAGATITALYSRAHPTRVSRLLLVAPSYPRASYVFLASLEPFDTTAWKSYTHDVAEALEWRRDTVNPEGFCVRLWPTVFRFHDTDASLRGRLSAAMCDAPAATLRDLPRIQHLASKGLFGLNLHDSLATVQSPTLVMIGATDSTTLAAADAWTAWLPQARELRFSSPGLFPWLGDHRRFFTAAGAFLSGGWPADAFRPSDPSGAATVAASAVAVPTGTAK